MSSTSRSSPVLIELADDDSTIIGDDSCETNPVDLPISNTARLCSTSSPSSSVSYRKEIPPCYVCGAKAHGYNFDQITCESCKAFFRRNALKSMDQFRCRNDDKCVITSTTRKRCKRCRLSQCFKVGMRKEWILTDEEKRLKRRKVERNRLIKQQSQMALIQQQKEGLVYLRMQQPNTAALGTTAVQTSSTRTGHPSATTTSVLPVPQPLPSPIIHIYRTSDQQMYELDLCLLKKLSDVYQMIIRQYPQPKKRVYRNAMIAQTTNMDVKLTLMKDLTRELTQMATSRLLHFFSLIPEFQLLTKEEQTSVLTKNMLAVLMFCGALTYNAEEDTFVDRTTDDKPYDAKYLLFVYGPKVYSTFVALARGLTSVVYQPFAGEQADERCHRLFLLLMIILLFSNGYDSGFEASSVEHQVKLLLDAALVSQPSPTTTTSLPSSMLLSDKLQKIQQNYVEIACRLLEDNLGLNVGRCMFQNLVPLLFDLQRLCSTLANVNLCELAEEEDESIGSSASTPTTDEFSHESSQFMSFPSSSFSVPSHQFSSTMISGTLHMNELPKENRAPFVLAPFNNMAVPSSSLWSPSSGSAASPSGSVLSSSTMTFHNFYM